MHAYFSPYLLVRPSAFHRKNKRLFLCCVPPTGTVWPLCCQDLVLRRCSLLFRAECSWFYWGPLWVARAAGLWIRLSLCCNSLSESVTALYIFRRVHLLKSSQTDPFQLKHLIPGTISRVWHWVWSEAHGDQQAPFCWYSGCKWI